jgi:hypothetical protein
MFIIDIKNVLLIRNINKEYIQFFLNNINENDNNIKFTNNYNNKLTLKLSTININFDLFLNNDKTNINEIILNPGECISINILNFKTNNYILLENIKLNNFNSINLKKEIKYNINNSNLNDFIYVFPISHIDEINKKYFNIITKIKNYIFILKSNKLNKYDATDKILIISKKGKDIIKLLSNLLLYKYIYIFTGDILNIKLNLNNDNISTFCYEEIKNYKKIQKDENKHKMFVENNIFNNKININIVIKNKYLLKITDNIIKNKINNNFDLITFLDNDKDKIKINFEDKTNKHKTNKHKKSSKEKKLNNLIIHPINKDNDNINNDNINNDNINNDNINNDNINNYNDNELTYKNMIDEFCKIYSTDKIKVFSNPKLEYRYFCYRYLDYIRSFNIPNIEKNKKFEAVIIEYRCFPHLEFVLRNAILKLGSEWSHTVICGNLNYDFIFDITSKISSNINIIKTPYDNLSQSSYSIFLASIEFWNYLIGEKILIYQEDSCIFKKNINDFLEWDYIGAPWPKTQNDNPNSVGNGGFSLRTKQCMIDVINKVSIQDTQFNNSTINYMKSCDMNIGPEDVYFSLNMINYNIGKVADWDSAFKFSSESFYNQDSLGGHNFWLNNNNWKNILYNNNVIQFKSSHNKDMYEHRGGWTSVLESFIASSFYNTNSKIDFFDMLERFFLWENNFVCNNKWAGIIHCTQLTPPYLKMVNIQLLFKNNNFIKSLDNCIFIISLSKYVSNYLNEEFIKINKNIKIFTFKYPVDYNNIIEFNYDNYVNNNNKYLIQIGQQLRKISSIYLVNLPNNYSKLWLTGTKNFIKCKELLNKEIKYLNLNTYFINMDNVKMKYTETFEEYDILLSNNIVFIDLFDASANTAILECIIRNTPIIINKIPAVIEYLGDNYPLYFNNLDEVSKILENNDLILQAHEYLKSMNKSDLSIDYFKKQVFSCIMYI